MIGIDYMLVHTMVPQIINSVFQNTKQQYYKVRRKRGWTAWESYSNSSGITLHFKRNKLGELYALFVGFSPHVQLNGGMHNANPCTIQQAIGSVADTLKGVGVHRKDFNLFGISSIEIGANFIIDIDPQTVLARAVMYGKYFFLRHHRHAHFKYACCYNLRSKYKKGKFYWKSAQIDSATKLTYSELGFCEWNMMRIEFKIQRASKFDFIDFANLESLFSTNASDLLTKFFWEQYEQMFFYSSKDVLKKRLSKTELKHYYQWQVPGFWQSCNSRKLDREKLMYSGTAKCFDMKSHIRSLIAGQCEVGEFIHFPPNRISQKLLFFLPYQVKRYESNYQPHNIMRDQFCNTCYYFVTALI